MQRSTHEAAYELEDRRVDFSHVILRVSLNSIHFSDWSKSLKPPAVDWG